MSRGRWLSGCALAAACVGEPAGPAADVPVIDAAVVAPNPHNVLSATVTVHTRGADRVAVLLRDLDQSATEEVTPEVSVVEGTAVVPVLGLAPARRYALRAIAYGARGIAGSGTLELTTDTLPSDLPRFTAAGTDPTPGYTVLASGAYGIVIDDAGRVVWYRRFPRGPGLNFMAQPNGRYAARPVTADPADIEPWVELDPLGNVTRTLTCHGGMQARFHDAILLPDGSYWLLCDDTRFVDLSGIGGSAAARVTGTAIQHVGAGGTLRFHWSPFEHLTLAEVDSATLARPSVNWTHGNAIDVTPDGGVIVSFRNLNQIVKVDASTGAVLWRLGGRHGDLDVQGTALPPFVGQHGARAHAAGGILLLDNTGDPAQSRAERYVLDTVAGTARLVASYGAGTGVVTQTGGSVQALPGGRTLVSFGTAGRVEEIDERGQVVWRITGSPGYVFRAQRIRSLYTPGAAYAR